MLIPLGFTDDALHEDLGRVLPADKSLIVVGAVPTHADLRARGDTDGRLRGWRECADLRPSEGILGRVSGRLLRLRLRGERQQNGQGEGQQSHDDVGLATHSGSPISCSPKDTMVSTRKFCMVRVSSYSWWRRWMNSSISVPASILVPIIKVRLLM